MAQLGVKNISKKFYQGTHDGVVYSFKAGELRLLDPEVVVHLVGGSNQAAIGGYALKVVPLSGIPEELRKEPETKTDSLLGVVCATDKPVEIMFDGKVFKFKKGEVVFLLKEIARELIGRSVENGKPTLMEEKPRPVKKEEKEEDKNKKEGK